MSGELGRKWRVLAHRGVNRVELQNDGHFDEVVVDGWLHVEQLGKDFYWVQLGGATFHVTRRAGRVSVTSMEQEEWAGDGP